MSISHPFRIKGVCIRRTESVRDGSWLSTHTLAVDSITHMCFIYIYACLM